jgi:hypothetical protein
VEALTAIDWTMVLALPSGHPEEEQASCCPPHALNTATEVANSEPQVSIKSGLVVVGVKENQTSGLPLLQLEVSSTTKTNLQHH